MNKGIVVAGNLSVDYVKEIDAFPKQGMLANILSVERSCGGLGCNTSISLAKLDPTLPLKVVGLVGKDDNGDYILGQLCKYGINADYVERIGEPTSFTDVVSVKSAQRTFFHLRGANAKLAKIPEGALEDCAILHLGYCLLLDEMDKPDKKFGTHMAKVLSEVQRLGVKTSIDVVSESGERFKSVVIPSLKYTNYYIANEMESALVTDLPARDENGCLLEENIRKMLDKLFDYGVSDLAVIHAPEGGYAKSESGEYTFVPSLQLPQGYILGTVGAGDAFCAGVLYALYKNYGVQRALELGCASAACCLSAADATSGVRSEDEAWELFYSNKLNETAKTIES